MGETILGIQALKEGKYYNRAQNNEVWQCVLYLATSEYGKITGLCKPHHVMRLIQFSRATPRRLH